MANRIYRADIATDGHMDELTSGQWSDVYQIWFYAIERSNWELEDEDIERLGNAVTIFGGGWEQYMIEEEFLDALFGFESSFSYSHFYREIEDMVDAAYEGGVDSMLDAYFGGVPLDDILA